MDNFELPPNELRLQIRKNDLRYFYDRHGCSRPIRIFADSSFFLDLDQRGINMRQALTEFFDEEVSIWSSSCLARILRSSSSEEVVNRAVSTLHTEKRCEIEQVHDMFACLEAIMLQEDEEDDLFDHGDNALSFFLASQNEEIWKKTDGSVCTIPIIYRYGTEIIIREPERFHLPTDNGFHEEGQGPGSDSSEN
ncbi:hypothetical protein QN277_001319 [Acacia crassicarpa]|uniref:PIN domain-containing protein n=1 Tax=Acacia crassicarpa TaxID=499986 RepID=A0AAE1TI53_9FABA|nr:hypothetical protein QN277_001319 [Acacia crassicarpa]